MRLSLCCSQITWNMILWAELYPCKELSIVLRREKRHHLTVLGKKIRRTCLLHLTIEITVEDKTELLELKKALVSARDCYNIVRTFGDEELKATVEKMQISNLPGLISEVQHAIDNINQKEFFEHDDETKLMVNAAMMDIKFNFTKIGEEEMKMISGGVELKDKYNKVLQEFMDNMDQDDPEYLTLLEAFRARMKDHGFVLDNIEQFYQRTKDLDEILDKLKALQKKNKVLLNKYKGDAKFARVHKRIQEENAERSKKNEKPIVSTQDTELLDMLIYIKDCVDQKVYDRNDILKKDAYFEKTVMVLVSETLDKLKLENERQDRMGVLKTHHHKGIGRCMFNEAKHIAIEHGYSFIQVKTVQMGKYRQYDETNHFYLSLGFKEFELMPNLWDEWNPCQIYVMSL